MILLALATTAKAGNTIPLLPSEPYDTIIDGKKVALFTITNGEVDLIVNSPSGKSSVHDDSYIRKAAIREKIPYMTTAAAAAVKGLKTTEKSLSSAKKALKK